MSERKNRKRSAKEAHPCCSGSVILSSTKCVAVALATLVPQPLPVQAQIQAAQNARPALPPGAPAQSPAASPLIKYQDGQLTIRADNAPLADILRPIADQTGAWIDFPAQANEPVTGRLGPGPVVEVLNELLKSTSFDYGIQGSAAHPDEPVRAIVRVRAARPTVPQQVQSLPPARPGTETAVRSTEEMTEVAPSREELEQRLRAIQENLLRRNAPAR